MSLRRFITLSASLSSILFAPAARSAPAPIVFFDIAGPDLAGQSAFYRDVFGWNAGPGGTLSIRLQGPVLPAALRKDPANKVIYIGVDDVAASLAQVTAHGGKVVAPRFEVRVLR